MSLRWWLGLGALVVLTMPALGEPVEEEPAVPVDEGLKAFSEVYAVLVSPRCMNCHPAGDAPLVGDAAQPHKMGITRFSPDSGLPCSTCHREEGLPGKNLPPADAHWGLPPANQVFQGRSESELCAQLNDPEKTGGRDLAALLEHVQKDALVLYGWAPGGERSVPPISHEAFAKAFGTWVGAGGPCR